MSPNILDALKFAITKMLQKETWDRATAATLVEWSANPLGIGVDKSIIIPKEEHQENIEVGKVIIRHMNISLSEQEVKTVSKPTTDN